MTDFTTAPTHKQEPFGEPGVPEASTARPAGPEAADKSCAFAILGNGVSGLIDTAINHGVALDEAVCVVAAVAADYARMRYGTLYLENLAQIVLGRAALPSLSGPHPAGQED